MSDIYSEGYEAFKRGDSRWMNPYSTGIEYAEWDSGLEAARLDNRKLEWLHG